MMAAAIGHSAHSPGPLRHSELSRNRQIPLPLSIRLMLRLPLRDYSQSDFRIGALRMRTDMSRLFQTNRASLGVALMMLCAADGSGQTSPSLLIEPWKDEPHWADTYDEPMFNPSGHSKGDDRDIDLVYYDSFGRVKLDRDDQKPGFWLGYRALTIGVGGDQPLLPGDLVDVSVAAAFQVTEHDQPWRWSLAVGAGTANDGHWSNSDALYGVATLNASHQIDERSALHIGLNYDGNRTFLPDWPLPYFVFEQRASEDFSYRLGLPSSGVAWKPWEYLTVSAGYSVPINLSVRISLDVAYDMSLFTEYGRTLDGFFLQDGGHTRLFYEMSRVSAGVRWIREPWIDLRVGVGYAFDQEFATGFDVRDLDTLVEPSDEMLVFFTVQGTF
jgi:hypothetical protein